MDKSIFNYAERLVADLIEQFRGKPNIEVLNKALARQLQEVYEFYLQLMTVLDIDESSGQQLDNIGDIVQLTRKEALALAADYQTGYTDEDALYRAFLYYKIFVNTAECTYSDIMRSIYMLWDGRLTYAEKPDEPATIILNFERFSGNNVARLLTIPIIKPAGVKIKFRSFGLLKAAIYVGGSMLQYRKITFIQQAAPELPLYLLDEDGNLLCDELGNILCERSDTP